MKVPFFEEKVTPLLPAWGLPQIDDPQELHRYSLDTVTTVDERKQTGLVRYPHSLALPVLNAIGQLQTALLKGGDAASETESNLTSVLIKRVDDPRMPRIEVVPIENGSHRLSSEQAGRVLERIGYSGDATLYADGTMLSAVETLAAHFTNILIDALDRIERPPTVNGEHMTGLRPLYTRDVPESETPGLISKDDALHKLHALFHPVRRCFTEQQILETRIALTTRSHSDDDIIRVVARLDVGRAPAGDEHYYLPASSASQDILTKRAMHEQYAGPKPRNALRTNKVFTSYRPTKAYEKRPKFATSDERRLIDEIRKTAREHFFTAESLQYVMLTNHTDLAATTAAQIRPEIIAVGKRVRATQESLFHVSTLILGSEEQALLIERRSLEESSADKPQFLKGDPTFEEAAAVLDRRIDYLRRTIQLRKAEIERLRCVSVISQLKPDDALVVPHRVKLRMASLHELRLQRSTVGVCLRRAWDDAVSKTHFSNQMRRLDERQAQLYDIHPELTDGDATVLLESRNRSVQHSDAPEQALRRDQTLAAQTAQVERQLAQLPLGRELSNASQHGPETKRRRSEETA